MARRAFGPSALEVVQAVRRARLARLDAPVVVACSGGADSVAMLAAAAACRGAGRVVAACVDHQLQPGSGDVAQRVVDLAQMVGVDGLVLPVEVDPESPDGPEAAARAVRLDALRSLANDLGGGDVLLGHTLDDQAETVLLALARGSGSRALAGMPARRGVFVRPLLGVRRATTRRACEEWTLPVWDDPHNDDPRFLRSRVRHELLPALTAVLGDAAMLGLARSADLVRADADALDAVASDTLGRLVDDASGDSCLPTEPLLELVPAVRSRVLRGWVGRHTPAALTSRHVAALDALVTDWSGQGPVHLPGGLQVARKDGVLVARPGTDTTG